MEYAPLRWSSLSIFNILLCMYAELSNFIKAICHPGGHWSWALRSPGTNRGGLVSPAPMWGEATCPFSRYTHRNDKQVKPPLRPQVLISRKGSEQLKRALSKMKNIYVEIWTFLCAHSSPREYISTSSISQICQCFEQLNIWFSFMLWMSLCGYTFLFLSL